MLQKISAIVQGLSLIKAMTGCLYKALIELSLEGVGLISDTVADDWTID